MKMKIFKKSLSVILAVLMALFCFGAVAFAADDEISVSLRIEGIKNCLYYGDVQVKANASVLDVVKKADSLDDTLTVTVIESQYGAYISAVNGDKEAAFKGWDGWLFRVNDVEPETGVSFVTVADGDSVVLYYGDPYGIGMQYPTIDTSKLNEGKISFTSLDTVYDANWNPTTAEVPVTGYTLVWDDVKIMADENGVCTIPEKNLTNGNHSVQIEKAAQNGCPLVLRLAPDFTVTVEKEETSFIVRIINAIVDFFNAVVNFIKSIFA